MTVADSDSGSYTKTVFVFDSSKNALTDAEFKAAMKGVLLAYEKASS